MVFPKQWCFKNKAWVNQANLVLQTTIVLHHGAASSSLSIDGLEMDVQAKVVAKEQATIVPKSHTRLWYLVRIRTQSFQNYELVRIPSNTVVIWGKFRVSNGFFVLFEFSSTIFFFLSGRLGWCPYHSC